MKQVKVIVDEKETICDSITDVVKQFGISRSAIKHLLKGEKPKKPLDKEYKCSFVEREKVAKEPIFCDFCQKEIKANSYKGHLKSKKHLAKSIERSHNPSLSD